MTQQLGNNNENVIAPGRSLSAFQLQSCFTSWERTCVSWPLFLQDKQRHTQQLSSCPQLLRGSFEPQRKAVPTPGRTRWQPVCSRSRTAPVTEGALKPVLPIPAAGMGGSALFSLPFEKPKPIPCLCAFLDNPQAVLILSSSQLD